MTNLPAVSQRVNSHIKFRRSQPVDAIICLIITLALLALISKPLGDAGLGTWWWGSFCVLNLIYAIHGLKTGSWKPDPANGLIIMTGPIAFYFWTILGGWRKYVVYKKGGYGWTLRKLEKELVSNDLSQGFDFDFPYAHRRHVNRLLRACKLTVEEILDEKWVRATGELWCLSITDTPENMASREAMR